LVEHRIENPCVPGSSPGSTTSMKTETLSIYLGRVFCCSKSHHSTQQWQNCTKLGGKTSNLLSILLIAKPKYWVYESNIMKVILNLGRRVAYSLVHYVESFIPKS